MLGHISRCEGRKTKGYQVRIPTGEPRKYTSKLFSDSIYGGKKKARAAAEAYLAKNKVDPFRTGYIPGCGIFHTHDEHGEPYWGASFSGGPTKSKHKPFRESVYGPEKAKLLAIAYRRAWEKAYDAGELDRFFAEDYSAQWQRQREYYLSPKNGVHIRRNGLVAWCGRDLREWVEVSGPADVEVCRLCEQWLAKYLRLGNLLLHYGVITPKDLEFND